MTKTATLTAAQYAKLINKSMSTTYRRLAVMVQQSRAKKLNGQWVIPLNAFEIAAFKRALVDEHKVIGSRIKNASWKSPIKHLTARREIIREALVFLGGSDILIELDRARINAGVQTPKCREQYRAANAAIEKLVAV